MTADPDRRTRIHEGVKAAIAAARQLNHELYDLWWIRYALRELLEDPKYAEANPCGP